MPGIQFVALLILTSINLIASDGHPRNFPSNRKRTVSDPVSNFISELGDLILDVDRSLSVQTSPKVEHERNAAALTFRPTDYFNRIQENYRNMQKRLGRLISNTLGQKTAYSDHELSTVSPPLVSNEIDATTPSTRNIGIQKGYNPFTAADEKRQSRFQRRSDESDPSADECSNEMLSDPLFEHLKEKCARVLSERDSKRNFKKLIDDSKRITEILRSKTPENLAKDFMRQGDFLSGGEDSFSISVADIDEESIPKRDEASVYAGIDDCSNEMLTDPVLEHLRRERCAQLASEDQVIRDMKKMDQKEASELLFSKKADKFSIGRLGDIQKRDGSRFDDGIDDCSNEMLTDPVLEHLRREKCAQLASEDQVIRDMKKMDPKETSEILHSKKADKFSIGRLGDVSSENGLGSQDVSDLERIGNFILNYECSSEVLEDPVLEILRKEKCARIADEKQTNEDLKKILMDSKRINDLLIEMGSRANNRILKTFSRRRGDIESGSPPPEGRIINEVLYSETFFDKHLRQLLKDHGQWVLDNPLLSRWRQSRAHNTEVSTDADLTELETTTENTVDETTETESTEVYIPTSTEYEMILSKSGHSLPESSLKSSDYYRIVNENGEVMKEEIDIEFKPYIAGDVQGEEIEIEVQEPIDSVILAFTPDGIPLKLRMGPEVDNPLGYLHKVLKSAGVSLNVPVESYDDLEPVGKEVLKLGSGILTRAVYIDVSNNNELKSLLKTLMKSKASGK